MKIELFNSLLTRKLDHVNGDTVSDIGRCVFDSSVSYLFLNEHLEESKKTEILESLQSFLKKQPVTSDPVLLIPTSGTTSLDLKIVVMKKERFLKAARRANQFLESSEADRWMISLPLHHVAGLSILARAHGGGNKAFYFSRWRAKEFAEKLLEWNISFCSLVPTQIFDLLTENIRAPKNLKRVLVGGSALPDSHYDQMLELGWPLVKTYGMTETAAFISFSDGDGFYRPLLGVSVKLDDQHRLAIQCDSLFEGYLLQTKGSWQYQQKKLTANHWSTEDNVEFESSSDNRFRILGRDLGMIKIKGELVNVQLLNSRLADLAAQMELASPVLHYMSNQRNENELFALMNRHIDLDASISAIKRFNQEVLPYERIDWYIQLDEVPRTELGKVKVSAFGTEEFKETYRENRKSILD